jgi:TBC1 domain family protein 5
MASTRTIKDAERELAELRLAMVGMGKAMGQWLASIPKDESTPEITLAWQGLERVNETLLDAAAKDVDDIVKEWGWHEGLEYGRRGTQAPAAGTDQAMPGPSSSSEAKQLPLLPEQPQSPAERVEPALNDSLVDTTPTLYTRPSMAHADLPQRTPSGGTGKPASKPTLHLSSSNYDTPMAALPRIPFTPPFPKYDPLPHGAMHDPWSNEKGSTTSESFVQRIGDAHGYSQRQGQSVEGLGFSQVAPGQDTSRREMSPATVDPLLGSPMP